MSRTRYLRRAAIVLVALGAGGCGVTSQRQAHIIPDRVAPSGVRGASSTSTTSTTSTTTSAPGGG